eukprot:m.1068626 g.1068626  ORF g.1068626 m.1068626 type:complete len:715 (+) comp24225_c0_seq24:402-2546(+)
MWKLFGGLTSQSGYSPVDEQIKVLKEGTRFSTEEIRSMLKYATVSSMADSNVGGNLVMLKTSFRQYCDEQNIGNARIQERLWDVFDADGNGELTMSELLQKMSVLLRGTLDDLIGFFFDIYDLDGDNSIDRRELAKVFSELYTCTLPEADDRCASETSTSSSSSTSRRSASVMPLSDEQVEALHDFFVHSDTNKDGRLSREEFAEGVRALAQQRSRPPGRCLTLYNVWVFFLCSWFEMGTSFSLPAMGALATRMKFRFDLSETQLGSLVGLYYLGACIGPVCGGIVMDRKGPGFTICGANIIVLLGTILQASAPNYGTLAIARIIIGFGGLITPFCTLEVLLLLFPNDFMLIAGLRNTVQSASGFLTFIILPSIANAVAKEGEGNYDDGTSLSLWFIAMLAVVSLISNVIVLRWYLPKTSPNANLALGQKLRALALAVTPKDPSTWAKWKLPLSFYLSTYGTQVFYFAPFAFTAFSVRLYQEKFGLSEELAELMSGILNVMGGLTGPFFGPMSDWLGNRALLLAAFNVPAVIGFAMLGSTSVTPWVATVLFALQYGFGDTVAYPCIRLMVGAHRAGVGYGIFGIFGNFFAAITPVFAGMIVDGDDGLNRMCWYWSALMMAAVVIWVMVHFMMGADSPLELPEKDIVEASDSNVAFAALLALDPERSKSLKRRHSRAAASTTSAPAHNNTEQSQPPHSVTLYAHDGRRTGQLTWV